MTAVEFVDKGIDGFLSARFIGIAEIYEVTVVGKYLLGFVFIQFHVFIEGVDGGSVVRFCVPLTLILGEQGKSPCTDCRCVNRGCLDSTGCRYMSADELHRFSLFSVSVSSMNSVFNC